MRISHRTASPMGVMPPYSIPVRSTASSRGRKDALRTSSRLRTTVLMSALVFASTTHAATRSSPFRSARHDHAVGGEIVGQVRMRPQSSRCRTARDRSRQRQGCRPGRAGLATPRWALRREWGRSETAMAVSEPRTNEVTRPRIPCDTHPGAIRVESPGCPLSAGLIT